MSAPRTRLFPAKLGLEMEMVVASAATGESHAVAGYFDAMMRRKRARGYSPCGKTSGGRTVAILTPNGESGLDNAFNHLESALAPVAGGTGGLDRLEAAMREELSDVIDALSEEGALLLNVSEHPDCPTGEAFYRTVRAPKPLYDHWVEDRGWIHRAGIDAKAQNGPTTSVPPHQAAQALNVMLALAPALIALFANSPMEGGQPTGMKENRLSIWPRMFADCRFAGDRTLATLPDKPFSGLGAYFTWAYGEGTVAQTLPCHHGRDYKGIVHSARLRGDPPLLRFLAASAWPAMACVTGEPIELVPCATHFEHMQFVPFLDARFRFRFASLPDPATLLASLDIPDGLEQLMSEHASDCYIEGRMPGANFPDAGLLAETGADMASSVVMSASALQAGLLGNLDAAAHLVSQWGWTRLRALRQQAIVQGLDHPDVHSLAGEVIAVASAGLDGADQRHLAYARWVCRTRRTGADRMLECWARVGGQGAMSLRAAAGERRVIHPREWG